jgi:CopG family transcriptional regulator / antitoxin EndoAI
MYREIDLHLTEDTLTKIDKLAPQGDRLLFINEAIRFYIAEHNKRIFRDLVQEGAIVRAQRDLAIAQEYWVFDEEI